MRASAVSVLAHAVVPAAADMQKFLLPGTHCLDGSPAGYYYDTPTSPSALWVIYLEGGGACYTERDCMGRVTNPSISHLGSSKTWAATGSESGKKIGQLLDPDPANNPDFAAAHHVYVPYCTGDAHSGTRNTTSPETWGLYFSGHLNFEAITNDLAAKGMSSATHVVLTGGSAGAIGAFMNINWLSDRLGSGVVVKGVPLSGWFFPGALPGDFPTEPNAQPPSYACYTAGRPYPDTCLPSSTATDLWQHYYDPTCAAAQPAGGAFLCGSVHVLYKYIKVPMFVVENQYDANQIYAQMQCPTGSDAPQRAYIAMYGEAMRNSTLQVVQNPGKKAWKDGIFSPSCLQHPVIGSIKGYEWNDIFGDWYFGRDKLAAYHQLYDDCTMTDGLPCNAHAHCQLAGSGPPAPPSPPAPSVACKPQMAADGCLAAASEDACLQCAQAHDQDLKGAGCTQNKINWQCKRV